MVITGQKGSFVLRDSPGWAAYSHYIRIAVE
jgi:hypothetical protein